MLRTLIGVGILALFVACTGGGDSAGGAGGRAGSGGSAGIADGIGGAGGSDANGGSGGAAGHGPGGYAWYEDPEIWNPIPEGELVGEACRPLYANPAWALRKILDWQPCGTGCEKAATDIGNDVPGLHLPVASTAETDGVGTGFLSGTSRRSGDDERTRVFRHTIRLDDGYLLSVLQLDSAGPDITSICGFGRTMRSALAQQVRTRTYAWVDVMYRWNPSRFHDTPPIFCSPPNTPLRAPSHSVPEPDNTTTEGSLNSTLRVNPGYLFTQTRDTETH